MTVADFLQHWQLTENPFRGEEARSDAVFSRMSMPAARPVQVGTAGAALTLSATDSGLFHSEFDKVLGDLRRPSSAVVFGEKGSGKTAVRLQVSRKISEHNVANPGAKVLLVPYDDLNPFLDRLHERAGGKTYLESLQRVRLVDHMDAILHTVVPRLVDALLGHVFQGDVFELPSDAKKSIRKLDRMMRREILLLQALYDRPEHAAERTLALRRKLGIWPPPGLVASLAFVYVAPLLILAGLGAYKLGWILRGAPEEWVRWGFFGAVGFYAVVALKVAVLDRLALLRAAHRVRRQVRVLARGDISYARGLRLLPPSLRDAGNLPLTDADTPRYACFDRLRKVLRCYGYTGMVIVVDRVDEPTIVAGDPDRMRAVVWPMLSNKFLQQEGVGVKLLLPMELHHLLLRESNAFFQEARLDKQHLVEELSWTGPMLYDLCEARMNACRLPDAGPAQLIDLFAEDVTRQELIAALDKVRQPRDAFKLLYRCLTEHCAGFTRGASEWRIGRGTLLSVGKSEAQRVQQVVRGIRPA
ncbi:MAG TPA: hypothetical protein VD971_12215 [Phycisphaerales bacterium]|nr:hypothetical protein [Phycisphaerales bacterium]